MRVLKLFLVLIIFLFCTGVTLSEIKENKKHNPRSFKKWRLEFHGGLLLSNSTDLNLWPKYAETQNSFWSDWHEYYHTNNGEYFTYSEQIEGEFKKIKLTLPLGIRLKYFFNSSIGISLGYKYFSNTKNSTVTAQYDVKDYVGIMGEYSKVFITDPFRISVIGSAPMIGIHYCMSKKTGFNFEGYVSGGVLFASCGFSRRFYERTSDIYGYTSETETIDDYQGDGTGFTFDAGLQVYVRLMKPINLFIDCGYSLQRVNNISGPGFYKYTNKDINSDGYSISHDWEDRWVIRDGTIRSSWKNYRYKYYMPDTYDSDSPGFKLDLSGFFVKIGISIII